VLQTGDPISYEVLERGTPVFSSDHHEIGTVVHVLAAEDEDVFDGIVIDERLGPGGHRFADADQVDRICERAVILKLDRQAAENLPRPSANPAVMRDDPADTGALTLGNKLKRAWEYLSGNY
jgi:hypothetical protein